jgi:hypothetical protein
MTDNMDHEQSFIEEVRKTLNDATETLDARTRTKLTQVRNRALETGRKPWKRRLAWPAGAVLATAFFLYLVVQQFERSPFIASEADVLNDMGIISNREGLDFYRDLDFYYWLSLENEHAG